MKRRGLDGKTLGDKAGQGQARVSGMLHVTKDASLPAVLAVASELSMAPPSGLLNAQQQRLLMAMERLADAAEAIHGDDLEAAKEDVDLAVRRFEALVRKLIDVSEAEDELRPLEQRDAS